MKVPRRKIKASTYRRLFSTTTRRREIRDLRHLPSRNIPDFLGMLPSSPVTPTQELTSAETRSHDLLSLQWPAPPRNILLVKKNDTPAATDALLEFAQ